jgi:YfiH family protein
MIREARLESFMPVLELRAAGDLAVFTDPVLREQHGIVIAFTQRTGGVSAGPYASLDLAAHAGDEPAAVDENRSRLLAALGLEETRTRLTCAEQVHGDVVAEVGAGEAGAGAFAGLEPAPVPGSDALITAEPGTPLLLCFADCVPVVLVATSPARAVAVVHAGWRGALARIPGKAAAALAARAGCGTGDLLAYVGPHVCGGCYQVSDELLCRFAEEFGSMPSAQGRLDLGAVVSGSLTDAGVPRENIAVLGACTYEQPDRFFSYRREAVTGRHGALAVILKEEDETKA